LALEVDHNGKPRGHGARRIGHAFLMVCEVPLPYAEMRQEIEVNAAATARSSPKNGANDCKNERAIAMQSELRRAALSAVTTEAYEIAILSRKADSYAALNV
jgi:hypothetical protein